MQQPPLPGFHYWTPQEGRRSASDRSTCWRSRLDRLHGLCRRGRISEEIRWEISDLECPHRWDIVHSLQPGERTFHRQTGPPGSSTRHRSRGHSAGSVSWYWGNSTRVLRLSQSLVYRWDHVVAGL